MLDEKDRQEEPSARPRIKLRDMEEILRARPYVIAATLGCLAALLLPSIVGVTLAARSETTRQRELVYKGTCLELSKVLESQIDSTFMGVKSMVSYVRQNPNCSVLDKTFSAMAKDVKSWNTVNKLFQLRAEPSGVMTYAEPRYPEQLKWRYGYNKFQDPLIPKKMVPHTSSWVFEGPVMQPEGFFGGRAVHALFLPAESRDQDMGCGTHPDNCPQCWDEANKLKFWGLVQGMMNLNDTFNGVEPRLMEIEAIGYRYQLVVAPDLPAHDPNYASRGSLIASSVKLPHDPVSRDVKMYNLHWVLSIAPESGWSPSWYIPCLVAAVLISFIISFLLMWMMAAMELQLLASEKRIDAEKRLQRRQDAEKRLLEEVFPSHVLEVLANQRAQMLRPPSNELTRRKSMDTSLVFEGRKCSLDALKQLARTHEQVTILFADITQFTAMCDAVPAASVMEFLNDLFHSFDAILDVHDVYKVETIGDCYMVAGGLLRDDDSGRKSLVEGVDPDHAKKVFSFAKEMLRIASTMSMPNGCPLRMRVGMHSGNIMSGVVGRKMPRYCLFGDTVNTAARMESNGRPGCVHVSAQTRALIGGPNEDVDGEWHDTGGVTAKGKGRLETFLWEYLPLEWTSKCGPRCKASRAASHDDASDTIAASQHTTAADASAETQSGLGIAAGGAARLTLGGGGSGDADCVDETCGEAGSARCGGDGDAPAPLTPRCECGAQAKAADAQPGGSGCRGDGGGSGAASLSDGCDSAEQADTCGEGGGAAADGEAAAAATCRRRSRVYWDERRRSSSRRRGSSQFAGHEGPVPVSLGSDDDTYAAMLASGRDGLGF